MHPLTHPHYYKFLLFLITPYPWYSSSVWRCWKAKIASFSRHVSQMPCFTRWVNHSAKPTRSRCFSIWSTFARRGWSVWKVRQCCSLLFVTCSHIILYTHSPTYLHTLSHVNTLIPSHLPTNLPSHRPPSHLTPSPTSHHPHTTTTCARRRIFGRAGRVSNPPKWCSGWCWRGAWARARGLYGAPEAAGTSRPAVQPEGPPSLIPSLFPSFLHSFLLSFLSSFLPRTLLHLSFFEQPCYVPSITHVTPSSFIQ